MGFSELLFLLELILQSYTCCKTVQSKIWVYRDPMPCDPKHLLHLVLSVFSVFSSLFQNNLTKGLDTLSILQMLALTLNLLRFLHWLDWIGSSLFCPGLRQLSPPASLCKHQTWPSSVSIHKGVFSFWLVLKHSVMEITYSPSDGPNRLHWKCHIWQDK